MGPWLCSHGNLVIDMLDPFIHQASMGPWLCSHGNTKRVVRDRTGISASMGPWLCSHGNRNPDAEPLPDDRRFNGAVAV